jgi:putative membrane protein
VSGLRPYDIATWALEAAPVVLALPVLWRTHRRFPLTDLLYAGVLVYLLYLVALALSGAYPGAERPGSAAIGRVLQGVVLALAAREILIRGQLLRARALLSLFVACLVLAFGAALELIGWGAALALGHGGGDARANLLCALGGALAALVLLSRLHDGRLKRLDRLSRDLSVESRPVS